MTIRFRNPALLSACLLVLGCGPSEKPKAPSRPNPFAHASTLPFQAPDFRNIRDSDYQPAIEEGMRRQMAEVLAIANQGAAPTFDNTIVALEKSGRMLDRVLETFSAVVQANTNPTLDKVQTAEAPRLAAHQDAIFLNPKLFARVKALYEKRDSLKLDPEAAQVLKLYYQQFIHSGANLPAADQARLKEINKQDASLQAEFQQRLVAGTKDAALALGDKAALDGLSDGEIATAAHAAQESGMKGGYLIALQNTTQQPLLTDLADRDTREKLFNKSWTRTERGDGNDTRGIIQTLAVIRAEKAKLLGYPNYAAYVLYDQMAGTPQAVQKFIGALVPATRAKAAQEAKLIQQAIDKDGKHFKLQPWDWQRYAEKVRKERYDVDESALKPYFELNKVLRDGVFYAANKLYGITFKQRHDIPVYQPDVMVFEVFDKDGSALGLIYFDYFKRDNKAGGAWMSNFVGQSKLLGTKPVVFNVANFTKPAPGQPALLSFDDVTTMFHEFGHALHGLFADQTYPFVSGTNVARDFVEFPSQFNEHWALYPEVLSHFAVNYKTGAPIPPALVDKLRKSQTWGQGYALGELLAASELDMAWHMLKPGGPKPDVDAFEAEALKQSGTDFPVVPPRYRSSYFLHIWGNGYAAGYYAYDWTMMLADDAYAWFGEHGGLTRANGDRFRNMVLSRGNTEDLATMYRNWRGRDPNIDAMKKDRGLEAPAGT
jgi:peptidyl-dipeptidase Dcp